METPLHYNTLKFLCEFFQELVDHEKENRMSSYNVAVTVGPNIFLQSHENISEFDDIGAYYDALVQMIENYNDIFTEGQDPENCNQINPIQVEERKSSRRKSMVANSSDDVQRLGSIRGTNQLRGTLTKTTVLQSVSEELDHEVLMDEHRPMSGISEMREDMEDDIFAQMAYADKIYSQELGLAPKADQLKGFDNQKATEEYVV